MLIDAIDEKQQKKKSSETVYNIIRDNILYMRFLPGSVMNEANIAQMLNVSRTPIREAFIRLVRDKLIVTYPQRGSYVTKIDMNLVQEGIFMRKCLEKSVYHEAALSNSSKLIRKLERNLLIQRTLLDEEGDHTVSFLKYDNQFHQYIFEAQKKKNIWKSIITLNTHFNRLRYLELSEETNIDKILSQHDELISAIGNHDIEGIDGIIETHMGNVMNIIEEIQHKYPDQFA